MPSRAPTPASKRSTIERCVFGQERESCPGARISLGCKTRERVRVGTDQRWQELGASAEGMSRWLPGAVHPRPVAVPRPGDGSCRRSLRTLLARLARIDVLVIDDWAMA